MSTTVESPAGPEDVRELDELLAPAAPRMPARRSRAGRRPRRARPTPGGPRTYWPALDGLRAVAVLGVLLYHAGVTAVPGGLLGVDVFFVLSGFLITGLLLDERRRTGAIALRDFAARRVRRLLPALLLVLVATAAAGPLLLGVDDLAGLRDDALAALLYVANWRFAASGQSYFDRFDDPSPLLHLWSLGVEEQFYVVWPLLVLLLVRRARRPAARVGLAALALTAASTGWLVHLHLAGAEESRLYYGTDTRALALVAGAATACLMHRTGGRHRSRTPGAGRQVAGAALALVVGLAGSAALAWLALRVDGEDPRLYDGGFLLVALAAVAVVASVVRAPRTPLARLLGLPPLVALGRISYGVYLWHWPVFLAADADRTGLTGPALLGLRLGVTLGLATLSYLLVERPIRRRHRVASATGDLPGTNAATVPDTAVPLTGTVPDAATAAATDGRSRPRQRRRQRLRLRLVAPAATLLTAGAVTLVTLPGVLPARALIGGAGAVPSQDLGTVASAEATTRDRMLATPEPLPSAGAREPVRVLVVGDSVGLTTAAALRRVQTDWKVSILNAGVAACGIGPGNREPHRIDRSMPDQIPCAQWPTWWQRSVDAFRPDVVLLLTGRWETADEYVHGDRQRVGQPAFDAALAGALDRGVTILSSRGARVGLVTTPCVENKERADGSSDPATSPFRTSLFNGLLRDAAARHPDQARIVDLHGVLCPSGQYLPTISGTRVRDDDGVHVTPGAGPVLAPLMLGTARQMVGLPSRPASDD